MCAALSACLFDSQVLDPATPPERLSAFGFFEGEGRLQRPAEGVVAYDITTPLFSDYAQKLRFVKLPDGTSARYKGDFEVLDFPEGTLIAKTFAYENTHGEPGLRVLETRVLWHTAEGWIGLPYVWNEEQTEARLSIIGAAIPVSFEHGGELRELTYRVPNQNQCKGCHRVKGRIMQPIGPAPWQLHKTFAYEDGMQNQLEHWSEAGLLEDQPPLGDIRVAAEWDDPTTGSLDERARVWLDINCAHCHNPQGAARTSNLDLRFTNQDQTLAWSGEVSGRGRARVWRPSGRHQARCA